MSCLVSNKILAKEAASKSVKDHTDKLKNKTITKDNSNKKTIEIYVNGMVCSFCAQGIKKSLLKKKSIDQVKVSLKDKVVRIITKIDQNISNQEITLVIQDAGYNVKEIKRATEEVATTMITVKVGGMTCSSCEEKITNIFLKEKFIQKVVYFSPEKSFKLYLKKNKKLDDKKITSILDNAGYKTLEILRR